MRLIQVMPLVAIAACAEPKPFTKSAVEPAAERAWTADPELMKVCAAAPLLQPGQPFTRASLTKARPRLIVRVVVPESRDFTKGEGELAVTGASRSIAVRTVDMATNKMQDGQQLGACFEDFVRFETGQHCVVLDYDGDARGRPLTFDFDFGSRMHYRATQGAYEGDGVRAVCGDPEP